MAWINRPTYQQPKTREGRTDTVDSVDVASDGRNTSVQEWIRTEAKSWLAQQRWCVSDEVYARLEKRVVEMLASQQAEHLDLRREFAFIQEEILRDGRLWAADLARQESLTQLGLKGIPDRYTRTEQYFGLDTATMSAIAAIERDTGISVMPALARLQDRIERSLQRSQSSTLPEDRVALLRSNLRNMVSEKVSEIPDIVSKRVVEREDGTNRIDRNDRWIVNDNIVSAFWDFEQRILPEAQWYLRMHEAEYVTALRASDIYWRWEEARERFGQEKSNFQSRLDSRLNEAEDRLLGNDSTWASIRRTATSAYNSLDRHASYFDGTLEKLDLENYPSPWKEAGHDRTEFLSEADRVIEEDATMACIIACVCQSTPYLGAGLSLVTDTEDVFSRYDATTSWLQRMGVVDASYRAEKGLFDNVLAVVGLVWTTAGMQGVSRIPKIAEAIEKLGRFGKRITPERIGTMTQRVIEAFEKWMKEQLAWKTVDDMANTTEATVGWERKTSTEAEAPPEWRASQNSRHASLEERLPNIMENSALPPEKWYEKVVSMVWSLTTTQRQAAFAVHDAVSKGILKNDWTDLRTMRQILTNTLPDERKSELRTLLESKGYNPAIIDNIAESPLAGKQVDTLIREGLLWHAAATQEIGMRLGQIAKQDEWALVRFAKAANDNRKSVREVREILLHAYREMGMSEESATDWALYVAVRSGIGTKASVVDTSVSIIRSLDGEPLISPAQINRILQRLVQEGIVAESDVRNIGAATLTEFRRRGITIKWAQPATSPEAKVESAIASTPPSNSDSLLPSAVRDLFRSNARLDERLQSIRNNLTDIRVAPHEAVDSLIAACGWTFDRATYEVLEQVIGSIEIYTTGRKNSLLTALTSQFLERSIASGVFENHAEAITGLLGETPDLSRVSRTLADLRERGKIDQRTEQVLSLKITSASERLVNNAGLSRLQDFLLNTAAFGIRQIDECFPSDAPPLVVGWTTVSAKTVLEWLDKSRAAPDPGQTRYLVEELQRRTPLGRMREMLSQNGLTVSRELLGGNNIRADGNLLLSTDDLNKILRGGGGRPLSPEEFHALENALRARVNETVERLRSSARYQPAVEKASNEAVRSVAAIRDELAQRFNAPSWTGRRIVFVPDSPESMAEAVDFFKKMRTTLYAAVARDDTGKIRRAPDGKPLLAFDQAKFRHGTDESDAMRQWGETWTSTLADTMRYLEVTVEKYTRGVRLNALLDSRKAETSRVDLDAILTPTERKNLLELSDVFAYIVNEFRGMAGTNNILLSSEVDSMMKSMRRDLWTLQRQLADPARFEKLRAKMAEVKDTYNTLQSRFPRGFGEEEQRRLTEFAMKTEARGWDISLMKPTAILEAVFGRTPEPKKKS